MKRIAVCPGSFDPITNGHVDVARRAAKLFGACRVVVMNNRDKKYLFSLEERFALCKAAFAEEENITVEEVKNMQKDWRDKKRFLHIFIPHNEIKEVELWISEAISFAEYENYEELTDKLKVLKDLSKEIPKTFLIRPDNIL